MKSTDSVIVSWDFSRGKDVGVLIVGSQKNGRVDVINGEDEMGIKNDCRRNAEGYSDPTAYEALKNMEQEDERFHKLLDTIFALCELSDFHIEERIVIKDKRTGRIWR